MYSQFWILGRLVVTLILMVPAQADFIMDDTDSRINYIAPDWRAYVSGLNNSLLFDGTA